jgi:transketolase
VSLEHYGASAAAEVLFEEFGITAEAVVAAAHETIAAAGGAAPANAAGTPTRSGTGDQL